MINCTIAAAFAVLITVSVYRLLLARERRRYARLASVLVSVRYYAGVLGKSKLTHKDRERYAEAIARVLKDVIS